MCSVVELSGAAGESLVDFHFKVACGLICVVFHHKALAQPIDFFRPLQFRDARAKHELKQIDELVRVRPNDIEGLTTYAHELIKIVRSLVSKYVGKIGSQYKRCTLTLDAKLGLEVAKKVAKVDVKEMTILGEHDVVVMPIADPEHIGSNAVAGEGIEKC